tara:strand:- start:12304 stop:12492 length:189 start_codon:yes stop_codon:yes gene_type:complete
MTNEVEVVVRIFSETEDLDREAVQDDICRTLCYNLPPEYRGRMVSTALQVTCDPEELEGRHE